MAGRRYRNRVADTYNMLRESVLESEDPATVSMGVFGCWELSVRRANHLYFQADMMLVRAVHACGGGTWPLCAVVTTSLPPPRANSHTHRLV